MIELILDFFGAILDLFLDSALYLLIGFLLAGVLKALVPAHRVYRHLGEKNFKSVWMAAVVGVPLPLCSCSTLPTAMSLKKSGASKGATTSFLISTPETGVDSIALTYALIDPLMTVVRPLAALATALVTGMLVNVLGEENGAEAPDAAPLEENGDGRPLMRKLRDGVAYSFGSLLDDLTPWLIIGFLLSGLIMVVIPDDFFTEVVPAGFAAMILMIFVGTPIYICAVAATPLAAALIAKGLDPGAAVVLLLVGPATNVTTALMVGRFLGKRVVAIYLAGVIGCALIAGALVNDLYAGQGVDLAEVVRAGAGEGVSPLAVPAAIVLFLLVVRSAVRLKLLSRWGSNARSFLSRTGLLPSRKTTCVLIALVVAAALLSSSFSTLGPGQAGFVVRFGEVVRTETEPGLIWHWPAPVERVERIRTGRVRSVVLGFAAPGTSPTRTDRDFAAESEVMTGEESILEVRCAVHYEVSDPYAFRYRTEDPEGLVRALSESALRRTTAHRTTFDVLVDERTAIEKEVLASVGESLAAVGAGVRPLAVHLRYSHSPPEVHAAFRDVASSLEEKERTVRIAEGYDTETRARARADAYGIESAADIYHDEKTALAEGEAEAFGSRRTAYEQAPRITGSRLLYEAWEDVLEHARVLFLLGDDVDVDLWEAGREEAPK